MPHAIIPETDDLMAVEVNDKIWSKINQITEKKVRFIPKLGK